MVPPHTKGVRLLGDEKREADLQALPGTGAGERLTSLQVRFPLLFVLAALLVTGVALAHAAKLRVLTGFESLLPESKPSVQELHRVASLTQGVSALFVILQGGEKTPVESLRKAADFLVPELEKLGPPWVGHAESGVHEAVRFLAPRTGLFLSMQQIEELDRDVEEQYAQAVGRATGLLIELEDSPPPAPLDFATLRQRLRIEGADPDRYPGGYYQTRDGRQLIVLVRSQIPGGDFDRGAEALEKIREVVDRVKGASFDPTIRVAYSGDLKTSVAEYHAVKRDLTDVGVFGAVLITLVVLLYYLRLRTVAIMLATIGIGVAWTFGATELTVGRLNLATGFLFSIIGGNGINFGILYMARYLESRRRGLALHPALAVARRETWVPTLTAASAAAASYGSLSATDFRGFHDFGLIGGIGMLLCWLATYLVLPPLLTIAERVVPLEKDFGGPISWLRKKTGGGGVAFGAPFATLAGKAPRLFAVGGAVAAIAATTAAIFWVRADPMEYDLRNLRTDMEERAEEVRLNQLGDEVTGHVGVTGMAILVNRPDQVAELKKVLLARRDAAPEGQKPFQALHALQDFVPADQEKKIPLLLKIRERLVRAHRHGALSEEDWNQIAPVLPPADLAPFGLADLPESVSRPFTENDGTRGRIVYISPTQGASVDDARYLFRWADAYRQTALTDGTVIHGSGRAVIYADMWASVVEDVPWAVVYSFGATVLVVLIAFRTGRSSIAVLGSLLVGVAWMVGLLVASRVKLNFLNFIALPITFGIGVDYAVNVVQRYVREGRGSALLAIRETGGAVILCSLTTILGYLALVRSTNFAVRSLGVAAFIGEICCLLASVLVLPAALVWRDQRRGARSEASDGRRAVSST